MTKTLPVWIALLLVIGAGVVDCLWTNRWAVSQELKTAVTRLEDFPLKVGDWDGQSQEIDARQLEIGEIAGYASYRFVNRRTGEVLSVLLVCGLPGPISVHTPDVCYRGAGYEPTGAVSKRPLEKTEGPPAEFWAANFSKPNAGAANHLRILWAWSTGSGWQAVDNPRAAFPGYRNAFLYKLYVVRPLARPDEALSKDASQEFLKLLLPRLQQTLFAVS